MGVVFKQQVVRHYVVEAVVDDPDTYAGKQIVMVPADSPKGKMALRTTLRTSDAAVTSFVQPGYLIELFIIGPGELIQ